MQTKFVEIFGRAEQVLWTYFVGLPSPLGKQALEVLFFYILTIGNKQFQALSLKFVFVINLFFFNLFKV